MDPLIVPIVTEMQRRHRLQLVFHAWRAAQNIERKQSSIDAMLFDTLLTAAAEHRRANPEMWDYREADFKFWCDVEDAMKNAGPEVAFQVMKKVKEEESEEGQFTHEGEIISDRLWKRVFRFVYIEPRGRWFSHVW